MRPGVASWIAEMKVVAAASRRVDQFAVRSAGCCVAAPRTTRPRSARAVATLVTRSTSSCASSIDQKLVFGQDRGVGDGVDGQQCVVGDDDIGQRRP